MSSKSDSNSTILHNGRSTSQISIYDYPEHLNPFYEAENHKRIRFWKIGKNKNNNNGVSRRGSFSLNGLKEMWAFKSFRPKKQSSSTFINKTSESPPPLRRDLQSDNYGTYDPSLRHTIQNDNFQRNVPYRTSLQDVRSSTTTLEYQNGFGNGFGRNQQYRSTIQTPHRMKRYENSLSNTSTPQNLTPLHRRYVYGGSVTPQPTIRNNNKGYNYYNFDESTTNFSRGSSQLSVATNPFEDDDDDIVMGKSINSASSNTSLNSRPVRKKRRAPQPPSANSQVSKAIEEESTSQKIQNNENDILNLTAEIETFVKNSDNNDIKKENNTKELIITEDEPNNNNIIDDSKKLKNNDNKTTTTIIIQNHTRNTEKIDNYPKATPRSSKKVEKIKNNTIISPEIVITKIENNKKNNEEIKRTNLPSKTEIIIEKTEENKKECQEKVELRNVNQYKNINNIDSNKNCNSNQYIERNGYVNSEVKATEHNTKKEEKNENVSYSDNNLSNNNIKEINIKKPPKEDITEKLTTSTCELKITESAEDIFKLPTIENESELGKYQIRFVPLKDNSPTIQRRNSRSSSPPPENYDLPPVPISRRRSVREIIESINRSQSLLKPHPKELNSNNNSNEIKENNLNITQEKKFYDNNNEEIIINNEEIIKQPSPSLSIEQNENNIIFEKCTAFKASNNNNSRESSPTTSNLDWNPVPKPKRTKKLTEDLLITEEVKSLNNNI